MPGGRHAEPHLAKIYAPCGRRALGGVQAEAMQRASEIFPNLVRATALTVHQECNEGDEDQEAGFAGAPFVQPAHDEEWMEYIDWGEVEAQASGSSSSGA